MQRDTDKGVLIEQGGAFQSMHLALVGSPLSGPVFSHYLRIPTKQLIWPRLRDETRC